ncbi:hypothetical protein [Devosia sp. CAU 1758]
MFESLYSDQSTPASADVGVFYTELRRVWSINFLILAGLMMPPAVVPTI